MKFSIGYNYDIKLLDLLGVYKDNIEALYFPIPNQYLGSGRDIPQPKGYKNEIPKIIKRCSSLNITSQLLLNATCEGDRDINRNISLIKEIKNKTNLKIRIMLNEGCM